MMKAVTECVISGSANLHTDRGRQRRAAACSKSPRLCTLLSSVFNIKSFYRGINHEVIKQDVLLLSFHIFFHVMNHL